MKKSAGSKMRAILAALTQNRVIAFIVGAFVTMVIQSSSATTVMLVSFVQAELMGFAQAMGVILGADIGTTITAQLIAFKLTDYALVMIVVGFFVRMLGKTDYVKHMGDALLGFGILFFGMKLMSDAMKPLRTYSEFIDLMKGLENPLAGLLIGTAFTALIQKLAVIHTNEVSLKLIDRHLTFVRSMRLRKTKISRLKVSLNWWAAYMLTA